MAVSLNETKSKFVVNRELKTSRLGVVAILPNNFGARVDAPPVQYARLTLSVEIPTITVCVRQTR